MAETPDVVDADVDAAVAAAAAALGRGLSGPSVVSAGSGRSTVLRCRDAAGGTVIVKTYPAAGEGPGSFAAEAAGLRLVTGHGLSPDLLAVDPGRLVVVMTDLGSWPTMADVLLGDSGDAARQVLVEWAAACGRLTAALAGRQPEFDELRAGYLGDRPDESYLGGLGDRIRGAGQRAETALGVQVPAGLDMELAELAEFADSGPSQVFSPGDLCPDNNLLTPDGVRFLDFEAAGFHSVFLDAAYLRMPFSTCWCVFRIPPELQAEAENAYRVPLCRAWPELGEEEIWQHGMLRGAAVWTLSSMWWLLGRSLAGDELMEPAASASPSARQLMRYRWHALLRGLEPAGQLPVTAELMRRLLAATASWQAPELPVYPAFR